MQLLFCTGIFILTIMVYYMLGRAAAILCRWDIRRTEIVCVGFFLYFALFQIVAEAMIFTKQKLHVLGFIWGILLAVLLAAAVAVILCKKRIDRRLFAENPYRDMVLYDEPGDRRMDRAAYLLTALLVCAVLCECVSAVLLQRSIGWDFAYYIGNMTTSVATDTMYLYDGSSGVLRDTIELRYALSSFYMNTAWISQLTGVSALLLQKYVTGVLCVLLANAVAYSFAMEVFKGDRKKSAILVTITILLTICWDVYDTSAQFLLLRGYEAKAYCANVVLPMVVFLLYRIWQQASDRKLWTELFLVSAASVPVSMSSVVLVPALLVLMVAAHFFTERRWNLAVFGRAVCCLLPNICYLAVYFLGTRGLLVVEV